MSKTSIVSSPAAVAAGLFILAIFLFFFFIAFATQSPEELAFVSVGPDDANRDTRPEMVLSTHSQLSELDGDDRGIRHVITAQGPSRSASQDDVGSAEQWTLSIRLVADNQQPIYGGTVVFDGVLSGQSGKSNELGVIQISTMLPPVEILSSPDCSAWFQAPGFTPKRLNRFISSHESGSSIEVQLIRDASLEVEVRDSHGDPVEGVIVQVRREIGLEMPDPWLQQGINDGGLVLRVSISGGRGRVLEESEDRGWSARTGPQGLARFEGLPSNESLVLQASRAGIILASKTEVVLSPAKRTLETLSVLPMLSLAGIVEDWHTGERLGGMTLNVYRGAALGEKDFGPETYTFTSTLFSRRIVSQPDGSFEVDGLSEGVWYVGPAPGEADEQPRNLRPSLLAYRVTLPADSGKPSVILRIQRGTYVAGVVVDVDGHPRGGVSVSVRSEGHGGGGGTALSNENGEFEIGPLNLGSLELHARAVPGLSPPLPQRVTSGDHAILVQMLQSSGLRVQLADQTGSPIGIRRITASRQGVILSHINLGSSSPLSHVIEGLGSEPIDLFMEGEGLTLGVLKGAGLRMGPEFGSCTVPVVPSGILTLENGNGLSSVQAYVFSRGVPVAIVEVGVDRSVNLRVPSGSLRVLSLMEGNRIELTTSVGPSGKATLSLTN